MFRSMSNCPGDVSVSAVFIIFNNYYQSIGRMKIVNFLSVMDGVAATCLFSVALAPSMGYKGVWLAQVFGCMATVLLIPVCVWITGRRLPRSLDDLMLLPVSSPAIRLPPSSFQTLPCPGDGQNRTSSISPVSEDPPPYVSQSENRPEAHSSVPLKNQTVCLHNHTAG